MNNEKLSLVHRHENFLFGLCILASLAVAFWLLLSVVGAIVIIAIAFFTLFSHVMSMAYIQVNGVRIRETQFPELYRKVVKLCEQMEIHKIPEVYIIESGGILNAFATRIFGLFGSNMVVLYSEFVDLAEDFHENEVEFVIAHELAHIKRNHVVKNLWVFLAMWIPFLGVAYSRMTEYTADRMAAYYTDKPDHAINALLVLASGKRLFLRVGLKDYLEQYNEKKGIWVTLMELLSTHPPFPKRIHAIEELSEKGPTIPLISRTKQVVALSLILGLLIPGLFAGAVFAGVQAIEKIDFLQDLFELPEYTPLMNAALNGDVAEVEQLLAEGNDPNEQNEYGESPLEVAVYNEYPEIVELLLLHGANPNLTDEYGWTPLMSAVMTENLEVGRILLEAGADPLLVDEYDMTAIDHAKEGGIDEFVELLEEYR